MHSKLRQLPSMQQSEMMSDAVQSTVDGGQDFTAASPFVCPGSTVAVSRAVHLARLNAAWSGCDRCEWRFDTEGLAARTATDTERIRSRRRDGIRRTEFGVRGQYINQLNRRAAARLIKVFCYDLLRQTTEYETDFPRLHDEPSGLNDQPPRLCRIQPAAMIAGYDSREFAPDIFVGVTSAIREFGMPVIDLGRCTAASALEAMRSTSDVVGAVIVTGAGAEPSFIGLDVFDRLGHSVPVIWTDHGVRLQSLTEQRLDRNSTSPPLSESAQESTAGQQQGFQVVLLLPEDASAAESRYRISRQYGQHTSIEFEQRYRQWLMRWYPPTSQEHVVIRCDDPLIIERMQWLSAQTGFSVLCRSRCDSSKGPSRSWIMTIDEDDRQFLLVDPSGQELQSSQLAKLINSQMRSRTSHVTAHADDVSARFWLADTGRPTSGQSTEQIRDALAVLGLVLQIKSP